MKEGKCGFTEDLRHWCGNWDMGGMVEGFAWTCQMGVRGVWEGFYWLARRSKRGGGRKTVVGLLDVWIRETSCFGFRGFIGFNIILIVNFHEEYNKIYILRIYIDRSPNIRIKNQVNYILPKTLQGLDSQ